MSAIHHQLPQYAFCTQKASPTKSPKPKAAATAAKPPRGRARQTLQTIESDGSTVPGYN